MRLDELARSASADVRRAADGGMWSDPVRYRRRRQNRLNVLAVGGAIALLVTVLGLIAVTPPREKSTAVGTTSPLTSTTSTPSRTGTTVEPLGILGAGWELLEPRSLAGQEEAAVLWTEEGLLVWGGVGPGSAGSDGPFLFRGGSIRDSATGYWRSMAPVAADLLCGGEVHALDLGDSVLLYGATASTGDCALAAVYDLEARTWFPVDGEFAAIINRDTALVWTGELVVAPLLGVAYDVDEAELRSIPELPGPRDADVTASRVRAHWTGTEVLAVGSGSVYAWSPGDTQWRSLGTPPVPNIARDSLWADGRLWVFNYQMAVAVLDVTTGTWSRPGDLPLRFFECVPEAFAVGDTPVVRMCSGIAIWDEVDQSWYPVPLEDLGLGFGESTNLVGSDDAIYSVAGHALRRFRIPRDADGSMIPPASIPIGVMQLTVPRGWELVSSFAPEQPADGTVPADETIGLVFESGDTTCNVASTYTAGDRWVPPPDAMLTGEFAFVVDSRDLPGIAYSVPGFEDGGWGILFAMLVPDPGGSDWITIRCSSPDQSSLSDSASAFGQLRFLWDSPTEEPQPAVGPGWETLDAGPVAGRMRVAAAWTGAELFVWGGTDGYIQPSPDRGAFYQDAYLFDPIANTWRPAASPPEELCVLTEGQALRLGDQILLRGVDHGPTGCKRAAIYDPGTDTWVALDGRFFTEVSIVSHLVWTGEWLVAPTAGIAYVPATGETRSIPEVPEAGSSAGPAVRSHWTGDQIISLGVGDVHVLTPGDSSWTSYHGPSMGAWMSSVWFEGGLFVVEYDNAAARFDLSDQEWLQPINLPLRAAECATELVAAGAVLPVAIGCTGMAIWDGARGFWIPIPLDYLTWGYLEPVHVVSEDAIYSLGEGFHRFPFGFDPGGGLSDPPTIPIGEALLDLGEFRISTTIGVSRGEYPDGSIGEMIAVALDGPGGRCHVTSTYQGPPLGEPERTFAPSGFPVLVFDTPNAMTEWAVRTGDGDVVGIHCESEDDSLTLVHNLTIP